MFGNELEKLETQRLSAFSIFTKAKDQLVVSVQKAIQLKEKNLAKQLELSQQHKELNAQNIGIDTHIDKVAKHIEQINSIIK